MKTPDLFRGFLFSEIFIHFRFCMSFIPYQTELCNNETNIYIYNVLVQEPVTAITDILITIIAWRIFFKSKKELTPTLSNQLYRYFFFMIGLATLLGGVFGHALCYRLGIGWKLPGWITSMFAIMLIERAAIMHVLPQMPKSLHKILPILNFVELAIMITTAVVTLNFFWVEFHAFYGLGIVVGSFELINYKKTGNQASKWILIAVGISLIAAFVQIAKIHINDPWFRAVDFAHVIMCVTSVILYKGVRLIKNQTVNEL
ncbi:MAG: hypothetical protein WAU21_07950 [Chitinophagales bacterium]|nr:hypothetical protein [Bacteroidota bacterium]MBK8680610.1 hypothetical protein [Bacteroidota bacterium]